MLCWLAAVPPSPQALEVMLGLKVGKPPGAGGDEDMTSADAAAAADSTADAQQAAAAAAAAGAGAKAAGSSSSGGGGAGQQQQQQQANGHHEQVGCVWVCGAVTADRTALLSCCRCVITRSQAVRNPHCTAGHHAGSSSSRRRHERKGCRGGCEEKGGARMLARLGVCVCLISITTADAGAHTTLYG
jgi:hypothetical protein